MGLGGRVRFAGWIPREGIGEFYAAARVLAVPARWPEPFGMIGLEAMHHGRPVVAFATGGIPDWLDDGVTGLLSPEQDVAHFAANLERLLMDHVLASRMGDAALERVQNHYAFESYLDMIEAHLGAQSGKEAVT